MSKLNFRAVALRLALFSGTMLLTNPLQAEQVSIHDPVMAKEKGQYFLYSTGPGIAFYQSSDLKNWRLGGRVFATEPDWAKSVSPSFDGHIWAPDIFQYQGKFYLYYSISAFGKNTSAIGVTVNTTLDPQDPKYQWVDQGIVLQSVPQRDLWNAIDPAIILDEQGEAWMSFGSFWGGLKLVKLDQNLTRIAQPEQWHTLAKAERPALLDDAEPGPAELEAPFIYKKDQFYYLFVSYGKCCRGKDSTYHMVVGRSKSLTGPYLDKEGKDLAAGGGSVLLKGNSDWPGLGHNSVYGFDGKDYLVFHAYEMADNGLQKLKITALNWDENGWPQVDDKDWLSYQSQLLKN
ncbi:arabinan endo-1,5-alpha-L-arabinosidase [Rheinheimera soli]|uniref:Extracellular exo-alpha-(1->5)-L-arabinofuranosidase n=1 Tax=Rheinheimera soli TaxID=443616 RepID=A0ABU1W2L8_9GAMM|nr:arabinan endo-1,5-alpha-L-arabinosidase [Rheinheimera soli]MDR7122204.1 arabinan endo-1,5-alpha-L-arabinosidase [Rheinheimera soli]